MWLVAAQGIGEEAWHTWLECGFDNWPVTQRGEAGAIEVGETAALTGLWKSVGGLPLPQTMLDPAGRKGRSVMLTRRIGVPPFSVERRPRPDEGKMAVELSVYFGRGISTSLYLFAVDLRNGRRDAGLIVRFGTGTIRYYQKGKWLDTKGQVPPDRWAQLRVLLDYDVNEYSVFAHGEATPLVAGLPISKRYRPQVLQFGCAEADGGAWLDDVKIRATAAPATRPPDGPPRITKQTSESADTARPRLFDPANPKSPAPSLSALAAGLKRWAELRGDSFEVRTIGQSRKGHPIHLCKATDFRVEPRDKQRVLVTTSRGPERNATVLALALLRWLLSDDPIAMSTRKTQEVYIMPSSDPDGYETGSDAERFVENLIWTGPKEPDRFPAGAALMRAITDIQPEVHIDVRSHDGARGVAMAESFGTNFESATARAYVNRIPHLMSLAAERAGFSCLAGEAGDGKIRATAPVSRLADHHYYQRNHRIVVPGLSYYHCHSISFTANVTFQESFLAGMKELFRTGSSDRPWRMERYPGYPVNRMNLVLTGGFGAWGPTAVERRRSRVELWSKMEQITIAEPGYGLMGSRALIFSSDPDQTKRLTSKGINLPNGTFLVPWENFLAALRDEEDASRFDLDAMHRMVCLKHRPSTGMYFSSGHGLAQSTYEPVRHGLTLQIYIPYPDANVTEIRLDGHPLPRSPIEGYGIYHSPGTAVEAALPPGSTRHLHVLTVLFEGGLERKQGFAEEDWRIE